MPVLSLLHRDAAFKEWHRLMLERQPLPKESKSVQTIVDAYLGRPEAETCKPNTRRIAKVVHPTVRLLHRPAPVVFAVQLYWSEKIAATAPEFDF